MIKAPCEKAEAIHLVEFQLISAAADIGAIAFLSSRATYHLAARIEAAGKRVGDYTVDELLAVIRESNAAFNREAARG